MVGIKQYKNMSMLFCEKHLSQHKYITAMGLLDLMFITYRIMPFIMVSFLVIISLFSGDISGFFVLLGLIISSLITIVVSKSPPIATNVDADKLLKCNLITLGGTTLSNLPLSTHIFSFIFFYFIYVTRLNFSMQSNALLLFLLAGILTADVVFNYFNCVSQLIWLPLIIGGVSGFLWAVMIGPQFHMVPKAESTPSCKVTNKSYGCKVKRTILSS